jgi:hypothetical protein
VLGGVGYGESSSRPRRQLTDAESVEIPRGMPSKDPEMALLRASTNQFSDLEEAGGDEAGRDEAGEDGNEAGGDAETNETAANVDEIGLETARVARAKNKKTYSSDTML